MSYQPLSEKWRLFKLFGRLTQKRCALSIRYSIYIMVGRSIASISNFSDIFILGQMYWQLTSLPYDIYCINGA